MSHLETGLRRVSCQPVAFLAGFVRLGLDCVPRRESQVAAADAAARRDSARLKRSAGESPPRLLAGWLAGWLAFSMANILPRASPVAAANRVAPQHKTTQQGEGEKDDVQVHAFSLLNAIF